MRGSDQGKTDKDADEHDHGYQIVHGARDLEGSVKEPGSGSSGDNVDCCGLIVLTDI